MLIRWCGKVNDGENVFVFYRFLGRRPRLVDPAPSGQKKGRPTQRSGMGLKAMREVERRASEAKCPLYRAADVNPLVLLGERW